MKTTSLLLLALTFIVPCSAQDEPKPVPHTTRERSYHVLHYQLNLTLNEQSRSAAGDATIRLVPLRSLLDEILLDAAGLKISEVLCDTVSQEFRHSGDTLRILLPQPVTPKDTLKLTIRYSVTSPPKGLYFIVPDSGYPNKHVQVWTQGEPEDNHYWFPCYDFPNDLSTSETNITVGERMTVISNGKLLGVTRNQHQHTATWHWYESKPHASYLISLVAGTYVEVADSASGVRISNYVYPSQRDMAMNSFGKTPRMIEYFSKQIGIPYPWEKYAQTVVEDFIYGGEENVSATTLTDATIHDARAHLDFSSDGLVAHELAHQWWGDLITCRDWSHAWLNEGFATYFQNLFTEYDLGTDDASKEILDAQILVRNSDAMNHRRPMVCDRYINPIDLFDSKIYQKGAVVLNMLRSVVGEAPFWKSIREYAERYAHRNVETDDFRIAVEEATGLNMEWFFDEWIYGAGYPELSIVQTWDQQRREVRLIITQTQKTDSLTGLFRMPVDIEVWVHDNPVIYQVTISKLQDTFSFPAYQEPQLVIFDKGSVMLKKVNFEKKPEQWIFQLRHADDAADRLLAIDELRWLAGSDSVTDALGKSALDDHFWGVRQEAVYALGDSRKPSVEQSLIAAYGDRDPRVRAAAILSLGNFRGEPVLRTLRHAFYNDSSYSVTNSALKAILHADSTDRASLIHEALGRSSRGEMLRITALQALAENHDDSTLATMISYTRYGVDRNIRIQAINLLAGQWNTNNNVCLHLASLLSDPSITIRRVTARALGMMGNPAAIAPLTQAGEKAADGRLSREIREALDAIRSHQQNH